jgi:8-oxo-dGTP diphosphatase
MLHRVKKEQDENAGMWIGVGGKFEDKESPEECVLREVREETGLTLTAYRLRGIVTFVSDQWETEYMYLFTATAFEGELTDSDEGVLAWIPKEKILELPHWEGDAIFLRLLSERDTFFSLKLQYQGQDLVKASLDGTSILNK